MQLVYYKGSAADLSKELVPLLDRGIIEVDKGGEDCEEALLKVCRERGGHGEGAQELSQDNFMSVTEVIYL